MGAAVQRYEQEDERVALRLIPGGKTKSGRAKAGQKSATRAVRDARHQDARPFRQVFVTAVVVCTMLVALGFGPVFLSAQATRNSQQAVLIQESLDAANARSEQLEMRRSVLSSSLRVSNIATAELGMVPAATGQMVVELDAPPARVASAPVAPARKAAATVTVPTLADLARLTAGQSSALMVGDVGLAATR